MGWMGAAQTHDTGRRRFTSSDVAVLIEMEKGKQMACFDTGGAPFLSLPLREILQRPRVCRRKSRFQGGGACPSIIPVAPVAGWRQWGCRYEIDRAGTFGGASDVLCPAMACCQNAAATGPALHRHGEPTLLYAGTLGWTLATPKGPWQPLKPLDRGPQKKHHTRIQTPSPPISRRGSTSHRALGSPSVPIHRPVRLSSMPGLAGLRLQDAGMPGRGWPLLGSWQRVRPASPLMCKCRFSFSIEKPSVPRTTAGWLAGWLGINECAAAGAAAAAAAADAQLLSPFLAPRGPWLLRGHTSLLHRAFVLSVTLSQLLFRLLCVTLLSFTLLHVSVARVRGTTFSLPRHSLITPPT